MSHSQAIDLSIKVVPIASWRLASLISLRLMLAKLISLLLLTLLGVLLFGLLIWWLQPKWSQPGLAVGTRAVSSTSTRGYADALRRFRAVVTSRH
ncbi:hypothetical protein [Lamprobacter modestohalophilus]|uniref:hypothetical protein n=1 Tax=Lamprobacter modestohalophilus TaxID=1064514 RepID=UPI00190366BD|nr:hypothetical protein [Lamprobacter modestohalophilus]